MWVRLRVGVANASDSERVGVRGRIHRKKTEVRSGL